mmetsp:Transcript_49826/g.132233  ORF Transcript_49826/g.132233 Transcript_49826/m.132233 type:complete len:223 (+) Transcript_49826:2205-2873(+)
MASVRWSAVRTFFVRRANTSSSESDAAFIRSAASSSTILSASSANDIIQGRNGSDNRVLSKLSTRSDSQRSRMSGQILKNGRQFTATQLRPELSVWVRWKWRCKRREMSFRLVMLSFMHRRRTRAFRGPSPATKGIMEPRCGDHLILFKWTPLFATVSINGCIMDLCKRILGTTSCNRCSLNLKIPFSDGNSCHNWHISTSGSWQKRAALMAILCCGTLKSR